MTLYENSVVLVVDRSRLGQLLVQLPLAYFLPLLDLDSSGLGQLLLRLPRAYFLPLLFV